MSDNVCLFFDCRLTPHMVSVYNIVKGVYSVSQWDKLIKRILSLSADIRLSELRKVLESYGYKMNSPGGGSSHYTFRKHGCRPITIPKHEPIKRVYVEKVRQIVESEEINNEND